MDWDLCVVSKKQTWNHAIDLIFVGESLQKWSWTGYLLYSKINGPRRFFPQNTVDFMQNILFFQQTFVDFVQNLVFFTQTLLDLMLELVFSLNI